MIKELQKKYSRAIYIDELFKYMKNLLEYEKEKYSFISDNYVDKKQVMINIIENQTKISLEINKGKYFKSNCQEISPNLILLGGTEIDVTKLYKSSQDALKEQKETNSSNQKELENKNSSWL